MNSKKQNKSDFFDIDNKQHEQLHELELNLRKSFDYFIDMKIENERGSFLHTLAEKNILEVNSKIKEIRKMKVRISDLIYRLRSREELAKNLIKEVTNG